MAPAKRVLSSIDEPRLKKARVSERKSSQYLCRRNVGDCDIVSSPPPVSSPAQPNIPVITRSQMNVNDSVESLVAGKMDELRAYLDGKFNQLEVQMDALLANFCRRISELEDRLLADIAVRCRTVTADGDEGVLDPSMGLSTDSGGQLRRDADIEDVGDNIMLQPSHHDTGASVISESSSQLVHVTKLKATCSAQTSPSIRR